MNRIIILLVFILCQGVFLMANNKIETKTFNFSSTETSSESDIPETPLLAPLAECTNISFSTVTPVNPTCNGSNNGSITVSITHTPLNSLFSLSINNGANWTSGNDEISLGNLPPGSYTLVITDKNGVCREYYSANPVVLSNPPLLSITNVTTTPATTAGDLGTITVTASGGTTPKEYSLDGANWQGSNYFEALDPGSYNAYVKDAMGCIVSQSTTVYYVVYIPNANFKTYLVGNTSINTNADSEIQVSEAVAFTGTINAANKSISNLTGIEAFIHLTTLNCYNNSLTTLDVSDNVSLAHLTCYQNSLTELDISSNPLLIELQCQNNLLTSLDLRNGHNNILTIFEAENNNLTCINVDEVSFAVTNWSDDVDAGVEFRKFCNKFNVNFVVTDGINSISGVSITINDSTYTTNSSGQATSDYLANGDYSYSVTAAGYENFNSTVSIAGDDISEEVTLLPVVYIPDAIFKAYLVGKPSINTNRDSEIQYSEAESYDDTIKVDGLGISDLTGIESFINLKYLWCNNNSLISLDVSQLTFLKKLYCGYNEITTIDVSNIDSLLFLSCEYNSLTALDVSNNTPLYSLDCHDNSITSLDLTNKASLVSLSCQNNLLSSLNLSNDTSIFYLDCSYNSLTGINLSSLKSLGYLFCHYNSLTTLSLSNNLSLRAVNCSYNKLTTVDVSNNASLTSLSCNENLITDLDLSNNHSLKTLNCGYNSLTTFDVSNNISLTDIFCTNNLIAEIDLKNNNKLKTLHCGNNALTILDLRNGNNTIITSIWCENTPDLECVSVDNVAYAEANWTSLFDEEVNFSLYCNTGDLTIDNVITSNVACHDAATGSITITASGGSGTLQYSTNNGGNWQTSNLFADLAAGTYNVKVKDEIGMEENWSGNPVIITQPELLVLTSIIITSDNGSASGQIVITATGGTGNYEYSKNNGSNFQSSNTFTGLISGAYPLVVKDEEGCEADSTVTVPNQVSISNVNITDIVCYGDSSGAITITATVSRGSLQYSIDNGANWQTSNIFSDLIVNPYNIKVKDELGMEVSWGGNPGLVNQPDELLFSNLEISGDNGSSNGQIEFTAIGGNSPYQYRIDNGTWQSSSIFSSLTKGLYTIDIIDSEGCENSLDVIVDGIVYIPDALFKAALLAKTDLNFNHDAEIQVSEAINYSGVIWVWNLGITDMTGIEWFYNITDIQCWNNSITALDVSKNSSLEVLDCDHNLLTALDVSKNIYLQALICHNNLINELDLSHNSSLAFINCLENELTSLDVSWNHSLATLFCSNNSLTELDMRNGNNTNIISFDSHTNPELTCISVDDIDHAVSNWIDNVDEGVMFSLNCDLIPEDEHLYNTTYESGDTLCFGAYQTITVGNGDGFPTNFNSGSSTTLIAGEMISILPGVHIYEGSFLSASITLDSTFCDETFDSPIVEQLAKKSIKNQTNFENQATIPGEKSIKVYPNPNNGQFTIELNIKSNALVSIFNFLGEKVYHAIAPNQKSHKINLPGIRKGIYFVKVMDGKEQFTLKMVVD